MWYPFNYIWIFIWALFNYISFNEGYKCGVLLNWISIICQLSLQQDIKQIRALTKGRSRTKCSIITLIKSSSTRPTEAGQTLCNLCNSVLPVCSRQSKSWIFDDSIAFNQCKNRSRLPFFPFQWRQIQVCTFVQKGIEWLKTNYSHS